MKTYEVNEIFYSIQGEGSFAGCPMVFIRFSGCNLKCPWCDTKHEEGTDMTAEQIEAEIKKLVPQISHRPLGRVCLTGGEPTLQIDEDLVSRLNKAWWLHLETNGTHPVPSYDSFECITISPKTLQVHPAIERMLMNGEEEALAVDLKIVWTTMARALITAWDVPWAYWEARFLQPCTQADGTFDAAPCVEWIKDHPDWRLSVQLQKILEIR